MESTKYKLLREPGPIDDLTKKENARKMYQWLLEIVRRINENAEVLELDRPDNFSAVFSAGNVFLSWDDVKDDMRRHVDGIRIWKAAAADNDNTNFNENDAKFQLVKCMRTTDYQDNDLAAGDYIYWIQWVNLEGAVSAVAGGLLGTVT